MRWPEHVARMMESRCLYGILVGKPERKKPLEDPGVDERIILIWIMKMWDGGHEPDCSGSRQCHGAGYCNRGNKHWRSIKCGEFLD